LGCHSEIFGQVLKGTVVSQVLDVKI